VLAIFMFDEYYNSTTVVGLVISLLGMALYSYFSFGEKEVGRLFVERLN